MHFWNRALRAQILTLMFLLANGCGSGDANTERVAAVVPVNTTPPKPVPTQSPTPNAAPTQFSFTVKNNAPMGTHIVSNPITLNGIDTPLEISISNGEYSLDGGSFTSEVNTINNGQIVQVRVLSSTNLNTTESATLTVGTFSTLFSATTEPVDTTPNSFEFMAKTGVPKYTPITSNSITVTGINSPSAISILGGEYSINDGPFVSTDSIVNNGAHITVRIQSNKNDLQTANAEITIGDLTSVFSVTTNDTTPDKLIFSDKLGAMTSTPIESESIVISGIDAEIPVSVIRGQYAIDDGPFTNSEGTIKNGQSIKVMHSSSSKQGTQTTTLLRIGFESATFTSLTHKVTPDQFEFSPLQYAKKNTLVESEAITITGIDKAIPISITNGEYSIDGNDYTSASGTIENGQRITLRLTTSVMPNTEASANVTVGDVSAVFSATTYDSPAIGVTTLSKSVELSWHDANSGVFNLYYSTDIDCDITQYSSCAEGNMLTNVTSPVTVDGLINSQHYYFHLETHYGNEQLISRRSVRPASLGFNDEVKTIAIADDGTQYIGGDFTRVGPNTGHGVAVDPRTKTIGDAMPIVDGDVLAAISDGNGGWYIGGGFTSVDGQPRHGLAHINNKGQLNAQWAPSTNGLVKALVLSNAIIYVGGDFTEINGETRQRLAAINSTGTLTNWAPSADKTVNSLAAGTDRIFAGGYFTQISGHPRNHLAAIFTDGELSTWNPSIGKNAQQEGVECLLIEGQTVFVGGSFTSMNTEERKNIGAVNFDGSVHPWDPTIHGNSVYDMAIDEGLVYVAGSFFRAGPILQSQKRENLVAFDMQGALTEWNPSPNLESYAHQLNSIVIAQDTIFVGGLFNRIGNKERHNFVAIDKNGSILPNKLDASQRINTMATDGDSIYVGGKFSQFGEIARNHLAAIRPDGTLDDWNPGASDSVNAIAIKNSTIYAGGEFSELANSPRSFIGAINRDGTLNAWNPTANNSVNTILADDTTIYIGGAFTLIGGQDRNYVAAVHNDGTLSSWNPGVLARNSFEDVKALALHEDVIYMAGNFEGVGERIRPGLAGVNVNGTVTNWSPNIKEKTTRLLTVMDNKIYAAGFFDSSEERIRLVAINLDGSLSPLPQLPYGSIYALTATNNTLYIGGFFSKVGEQPRERLAAINSDGSLSSWAPTANQIPYALATHGDKVYMGGKFKNINSRVQSHYTVVDQSTGDIITE